MAFFGLTNYGVSDYFKFIKKPEYVEPEKSLDLDGWIKKDGGKKTVFELISQLMYEVDMDRGQADGYAYKSRKRVDKLRELGYFKPDGPSEMYRIPATESMNVGWFLSDPALEEGRKWWLPLYRSPVIKSEKSRLEEELLKK